MISQECVNRALKRIVLTYNQQAMKNGGVLLPAITTHDLRHTFANILCERNVNLKVAQKLLGHADIQTTMDIYTQVSQEFIYQEYMEKLEI